MGVDTTADEIQTLKLEILKLETKLRDLHGSDTVANKHALTSLKQHVGALEQENQGVDLLISQLDLEPFNQKIVEEELGVLTVTALSTYVADRLINASRVLESKELRGVVWTLSATYVAWRVTFGFWKKLGRRVQNNIRCKSELEFRHRTISKRIDVMHQLASHEDGSADLYPS